MFKVFITSLVFYCCMTIIVGYSASVTLILKNANRNWTSIICPPTSISRRLNVTIPNIDDSIKSSISKIAFKCKLIDDNKSWNVNRTLANTPYHFTMYAQIESKILLECIKIDECFEVRLLNDAIDVIFVYARILKTCFSARIPFRYELRQGNLLITQGVVDIYLSSLPKIPASLHLQINGTQIISIDSFIQNSCKEDVLTSTYKLTYEIKGGFEKCRLANNTICQISTTTNDEEYKISCPIYSKCDTLSMCSSIVVANIHGVNKLNLKGESSRRFSKSLAYITSRHLLPNITQITLKSLTLTFHKPVHCLPAHEQFQYKISYKKASDIKLINFPGEVCKTNDEFCTAKVFGLEMGTEYQVCVSYGNIFDIKSSFSEPYCINATTASRPCQAPTVYNISPIRVNRRYWKAILYWRTIDDTCWNDDLNVDSPWRYYRVEVSDWNGTSIHRIASTFNHTSKGLLLLYYFHDYSIKLTSCNMHGCIDGPKTYLNIKRAQATPPKQDNKQEVTETVLICVLSILFLAASTFLYIILKKRKQFKRLSLRRKLQPTDIQVLKNDNQFVMNKIPQKVLGSVSYDKREWLTTTPQVKLCPVEHVIITKPLLTRSANSTSTIPENSTLV